LLVDLEGHGREEFAEGINLSRTVGWFTSVFPVLLRLGGTTSLPQALRTIKEQLRNIPNRGLGYGVLKYLSSNPEPGVQLRTQPRAEISFNYLGQLDRALSGSSLFEPASEPIGPSNTRSGKRIYLLEVY